MRCRSQREPRYINVLPGNCVLHGCICRWVAGLWIQHKPRSRTKWNVSAFDGDYCVAERGGIHDGFVAKQRQWAGPPLLRYRAARVER